MPGKKGPVRLEAIVPLAIVAGLIVLYFTLFFDMHLRRGLEYGATLANGAEVDIGKLDTSLWNASVLMGDIEVTDPGQPARNRVQIGAVNFRMLWDALLRGKVVIDEASITDVQIDTPRSSPGRALPAGKSADGASYSDMVLEQVKDEFSGNVLGDLAAIAAGGNPVEQLTSLGTDLKSSAQIAGMQRSMDEKSQQWQSRMAAMPKGEDFSALQQRLDKVKLNNFQDVTQIQASLQELESIRNDFDAKSRSVRETGIALGGELGQSRSSFSVLDKSVQEDVRSLQARMHLPSLDARTLARALFGMDVLARVQQARGYMELSRSYMPVKSDKKQAVSVSERSKGRDYAFGRPNSYPRFWLRKALISSRLQGGVSALSGEILDASTDQSVVGRPMVVSVMGDFPQQGVSGIKAELVINHVSFVPVERLVLEVGRYAVAARSLASSPNVELGLSKAEGSAQFAAQLRDDSVDVRMVNRFTQVAFDTKAQSDVVRDMINASVAGLDAVNFNAHVTGTWSKLDWQLSTNLADALEHGMRSYLQGKTDEARARIESMVNGKIDEQRKRLYARQGEIESALKSALAERQAQIDKLRAGLDGARNKLLERQNALLGVQRQKLKQGSGKLLDSLRKGF